jgi:hypothetical protein
MVVTTSSNQHDNINRTIKKADVAEHPGVFDHVGLLSNEPLGAGRVALHLVIRRNTGKIAANESPNGNTTRPVNGTPVFGHKAENLLHCFTEDQ